MKKFAMTIPGVGEAWALPRRKTSRPKRKTQRQHPRWPRLRWSNGMFILCVDEPAGA